jgi:hypothetical protein
MVTQFIKRVGEKREKLGLVRVPLCSLTAQPLAVISFTTTTRELFLFFRKFMAQKHGWPQRTANEAWGTLYQRNSY